MKTNKIIIALSATAILIVVLAIIGFIQTSQAPQTQKTGTATLKITAFSSTTSRDYSFANETALQFLEDHASVNVTDSKYGVFVNCINSICSGNDYYWIYYTNGKEAQVGAGSYFVKANDTIEFRYEKYSG